MDYKLKLSASLCLLLALGCSQKSVGTRGGTTASTSSASTAAVATPVPNGKMRVAVTISVTGIAHLIDDGNNKLVIFPNGTGYSTKHELLLLASKRYSPTGLGQGPTPQIVGGTTVDTYYYQTLSPGIEIDLGKSGFDAGIDPVIIADATGDGTHEACPSQQLAPRTSLHWLPGLNAVSHGSGVIDTDQTKPLPDKNVISARMAISGGSLTAQLPPSADVFEFKTSAGNDAVQAVADRLNYTFFADVDMNNPVVELWAGPYGGSSSKIATATASKLAKSVTFVLANVPLSEFFAPVQKPTLDHFEHYYDIYKSGSFMKAVPTRGKPEDSCGGGVGGGVECGPDRP
jgi:hypothetical protein